MLFFKTPPYTRQCYLSDLTLRTMQTSELSLNNSFDAPAHVSFALGSKQYGSLATVHQRLYLRSRTLPL